MRSFEIDFFPKSETRGEEFEQFDDLVNWFLASLSHNGNIVGEWQILELEECVQARVLTPTRVSLNVEFFSVHARETLSKVLATSQRPPDFRCVKEKSDEETCCTCHEPGSYILFTTYLDIGMPVDCGDCRRAVPLYLLPHLENEKSHQGLLYWHETYAALDTLFMHSYIGERFSYRHLAGPRSKLTRWTQKLAAQLEDKTEKPVYSYLMHSYQELGDDCPVCKRGWRLAEPQGFFDFKCEHCRLVSSESSAEATPLSELHP